MSETHSSTLRTPAAAINVSELIDNSEFGRLQIVIFTLCMACLIMDGFDVQALGYVGPAVIRDWHVPSSTLGPVFGAGNFGVLLGSLFFTILADKIGRRPALLGAVLFFSALTLLTTQVHSISQLLVVRFTAGLGMGCIVPNAAALTGEYSPRRARIAVMAIISVGLTAGAAVGGFLAAYLIPRFGWQSVFYVGGAFPLLIAAAMFFWLPESLQFMVLRRKHLERVGKLLRRVAPQAAIPDGAHFVVPEENRGGVPVPHLFRDGRALGTILLWSINFLNLMDLYSLANWLPTVLRDAGFSSSTAVLIGTTLQVGGVAGTFWLAWCVSRVGFVPVLTASFAIACLSIALIGRASLPLVAIYVVVLIAGACIVGAQPILNALSGTYYPTYLRSTGIGWALGIGRAGAIVGPVLAGELLALHWSTEHIFVAAAVPAVLAMLLMFSLRWAMTPEQTAGIAPPSATMGEGPAGTAAETAP